MHKANYQKIHRWNHYKYIFCFYASNFMHQRNDIQEWKIMGLGR